MLEMQRAEIRSKSTIQIASVVTSGGEVVTFAGEAKVVDGDVVGRMPDGKTVRISLVNVERATVIERKLNTWKTVGLTVGIIAAVVAVGGAIVAATKQSCPFVYSWDGSQYVFDAEPYGGAVTRGLERSDDTVLDFVKPAGGEYRLMMTNEVLETQRTNHVALRAVDAAPGVRVVPDDLGALHGLRAPQPPLSARTADGRDVLPWLRAADPLVLETEPALGPAGETRDEIVLTFPKPPGAVHARLVVSAGSSLFGSNMIRESLKLRGRELGDWYQAMDSDPGAVQAMWQLIEREELWALRIDLLEPQGWATRGILRGTGPLVVKDRVVVLDTSGVPGTTLTLRVRPPRGYWALNSFAVDYGPEEPLAVTDVSLASARDSAGHDRREALLAADGSYDDIPIGGDAVALTFPVPPQEAGTVRTVVLHARGYYTLDLDGTGEPDRETLRRLETEPGFGVRLAAERWRAWQDASGKGAR
ncbi:MAG TPA: hypothetical protein VE129_07940, partial [Thermoanaerobaculia bacterium]|nr:hypothetical protein [Thermoanaerobaculia bacterium]